MHIYIYIYIYVRVSYAHDRPGKGDKKVVRHIPMRLLPRLVSDTSLDLSQPPSHPDCDTVQLPARLPCGCPARPEVKLCSREPAKQKYIPLLGAPATEVYPPPGRSPNRSLSPSGEVGTCKGIPSISLPNRGAGSPPTKPSHLPSGGWMSGMSCTNWCPSTCT